MDRRGTQHLKDRRSERALSNLRTELPSSLRHVQEDDRDAVLEVHHCVLETGHEENLTWEY
jgi:hypothetical protein